MGLTGRGKKFGQMAKNCMKITKSAFLGQNSGEGWGHGGDKPIFSGSGGIPPSPPPPLEETLCMVIHQTNLIISYKSNNTNQTNLIIIKII